jgi:hypothetical protein
MVEDISKTLQENYHDNTLQYHDRIMAISWQYHESTMAGPNHREPGRHVHNTRRVTITPRFMTVHGSLMTVPRHFLLTTIQTEFSKTTETESFQHTLHYRSLTVI